ncbi:unnamed protein product [Rotaria sordida]|uniref:Nuclear receptor domain-containing protein n=5 Tax=Rotaria sordida TaxID=392033 RepID=A0A820DA23_9BILA|nr:unnamed protein product [Rotaria sordida]
MIRQKVKPCLSECRICGSPAFNSNFGVISCNPCKMFFKRNALSDKKLLKCDFDDQCEININNRHICASCRLSKCLKSGMKVERIRTSIRTAPYNKNKNKNKLSTSLVKLNEIEQIPTLNLLKGDNSSLTNNQWILLSNLLNSYNESKLLLLSQQFNSEHNLSKCLITVNKDLVVRELMTCFYETAGIYLRFNNDINQLSSNDRSVLLHTAADNITCLGGIFIFHHCDLLNHKVLMNLLDVQYGKMTMKYHRCAARFTPSDIVLFKLALSLFAFSSNARIFHRDISIEFDNINQILEIQNQYVELTWKYLICKYGYCQAIQKFMNLIQWFLSMSVFMSCAHNAQAHVNDIESLIEQTELTFILDDADKIVEVD